MNINNLINVRRWTSDGCSGKQHRYDDISDHVGVGDDDEDDKIFGWQASMQEMTIAVDGDAWTIVTSTTLKSMSKAFKVQLPWNPKNVDKCTTILKSMSKLSRLLRAGCNDLDIQECTYMFISLEIYVKRLQGRLLNILHSNPHKRGKHEPFPIFLNFTTKRYHNFDHLVSQLGVDFDEKTADMRDVRTRGVFEAGKLVLVEKVLSSSPSSSKEEQVDNVSLCWPGGSYE